MGFRPETTIYKLRFEGTWLDGLIVRVGCLTVREFNEMLRWQSDADVSVAESNDLTLGKFFEKLVEWNLENPDDGEPTPHSMDGVNRHEQPVIREILAAWQRSMSELPTNSRSVSSNGSNSLELSLGLGEG